MKRNASIIIMVLFVLFVGAEITVNDMEKTEKEKER